MKKWSSQWTQFMQLREEASKKNSSKKYVYISKKYLRRNYCFLLSSLHQELHCLFPLSRHSYVDLYSMGLPQESSFLGFLGFGLALLMGWISVPGSVNFIKFVRHLGRDRNFQTVPFLVTLPQTNYVVRRGRLIYDSTGYTGLLISK